MGLHRHLILLVVCLFGSARWAGAADGCTPPDRPVGWIVSVQSWVEVRADPGAPWHLARPEETLCSRAIVQVGDRSRARIALANAPVSLDENTTLHLVGGPELIRAATDEPLLIRLARGALYVFSRKPRGLTINTPFVAAGIEGTEFLVRVEADRTQVIVFEGVVAARNPHGEARVASGQSVVAEAGKAPVPVVVVRPRDAVQWALYYPPVLTALADPEVPPDLPRPVREALLLAGQGDLTGAFARLDRVPEAEHGASFYLHRAALLLSVGRVDEARGDIDRALFQEPAAGLAYALRTIIAVAQNEKAQALADARRAVELNPRQAAPKIALSYAEQAHFELKAARGALLAAVEDEPKNALAWARLAELWLMLGYRDRAREAAETAAILAPQLERTQTVLGFAALAEFRTRAAKAAFERAIALNTADPLPRFGLGLARIRQGDLEDGRQDIEIAVGLDPTSALLRSYLGKAYFEERTTNPLTYFKELVSNFPNQENTLAAEQFAIAKQLDPNDPTPWLYEAIRLQSENRPIEALRDLEKSIELNENRAVFRSRELLDQDRAARGASLGRIYNDLGFEQLGINEAAKSLALDPASASAHRFLSDIYATQPRRESARVSELLQAQLLQDININPVQPSLSETNLNVFARGGPTRPGFNEFTPLFERNQVQLNLSGEAGSNDTFADEAVISGLYNRFSASAGQFHYETDGFRENNDLQHDIYNLFAQAAVAPELNVQAEFRRRESKEGDRRLDFNLDQFDLIQRRETDQNLARGGLRLSPSPNSDILVSLMYSDRAEQGQSRSYDREFELQGLQGEAQYIFRSDRVNIITGFSVYNFSQEDFFRFPNGISSREYEISKYSAYTYSNMLYPKNVLWTIGLGYDYYKEADDNGTTPSEDYNIKTINPKFGAQWQITNDLSVRFAVSKTIKPGPVANPTIEPTEVAGFQQFFDDFSGAKVWRYGIGLDSHVTGNLSGGIELSKRNLQVPFRSGTKYLTYDWKEKLYRAYLYWTPHPQWALRSELQIDKFDKSDPIVNIPRQVETTTIPFAISYFHSSGFLANLSLTYVYQDVSKFQFQEPDNNFVAVDFADSFAIVDISVGYRLPKRRGLINLEVRNLFNSSFNFQGDHFREYRSDNARSTIPFLPERTILARLDLNF